MGQVTIFSGAARRRQWSDEEKISLVAKAFAPGAIVSRVARAVDVHPSQLYRWRTEFGMEEHAGSNEFAELVVGTEYQDAESAAFAIQVRVNGVLVNISNDASAELVATTLKVLVQ